MTVHPILSLMANMMNYLNVSLYEGQFTYNDEQARATLNEIYDRVSVSNAPPSLSDTDAFYRNVGYLRHVTDTDDADYARYMCEFRRYVVAAAAKPISNV
jgi:hypothetical protein